MVNRGIGVEQVIEVFRLGAVGGEEGVVLVVGAGQRLDRVQLPGESLFFQFQAGNLRPQKFRLPAVAVQVDRPQRDRPLADGRPDAAMDRLQAADDAYFLKRARVYALLKDAVSHRGKALRALAERLKQTL